MDDKKITEGENKKITVISKNCGQCIHYDPVLLDHTKNGQSFGNCRREKVITVKHILPEDEACAFFQLNYPKPYRSKPVDYKMNIYLCGAITSDINYMEKFKRMEKRAKEITQGMVFNPTKIISPDATWEEAMVLCRQALKGLDIIPVETAIMYTLEDVQDSRGAQEELDFAKCRNWTEIIWS